MLIMYFMNIINSKNRNTAYKISIEGQGENKKSPINEISKELSAINTEIVELERAKANLNIEYIRKYSFENIENLSKLKSYVRLRVSNLNLDLETPYKANTEDVPRSCFAVPANLSLLSKMLEPTENPGMFSYTM